ncbi:MAG: hypothetical protein KF749_14290 [Bacteroidetes bacterium]|nr:hypothetical protein [Bacteroidota bacterium]MCW5894088.1 hypothetical protein [Bacteroidota bacterium]
MKAEEFATEKQLLNGIDLELTTYRIGDEYYCHVSNLNPGATIARAGGKSRDEAVHLALERVKQRL